LVLTLPYSIPPFGDSAQIEYPVLLARQLTKDYGLLWNLALLQLVMGGVKRHVFCFSVNDGALKAEINWIEASRIQQQDVCITRMPVERMRRVS